MTRCDPLARYARDRGHSRDAAARASLAANNRCPRSSRFEPSASHRIRIASLSIMRCR